MAAGSTRATMIAFIDVIGQFGADFVAFQACLMQADLRKSPKGNLTLLAVIPVFGPPEQRTGWLNEKKKAFRIGYFIGLGPW